MCSRYKAQKEFEFMVNGTKVWVSHPPRYNVPPRSKRQVIVEDIGAYKTVEMTWGWQPVWSKQLLINAQAETVEEKPTFKKYLHQRCLIPADGFYEFVGPIGNKQPIMFTKPNNEPFCFAGLWLETTTQPEDVPITEKKFVILTTTPNKTVGKFHDRMPFIVQPNHYGWWLNCTDTRSEMYRAVLERPDRDELQYVPVQRDLNNVKNEGPELIRPVAIQKEML